MTGPTDGNSPQPGAQGYPPQNSGHGATPYQPPIQPSPQNFGWEQPPKQGQNTTPFIIVGAVLASVLLIGGALFLILRNNNDQTATQNVATDTQPQVPPAPPTIEQTTTTAPPTDDELMFALAEIGFPSNWSITDTQLFATSGGSCNDQVSSVGFQSGLSRTFDTEESVVDSPFFVDQEVQRFDTTENASSYMETLERASTCSNSPFDTEDGFTFDVSSEVLASPQYGTSIVEVSATALERTGEIPLIYFRGFAIQNETYTYSFTLSSFKEVPREELTQNLELFAQKHGL